MTVKLDGDIIMGEIAATADKRYLNPAYGSLEDMGQDYDHILDKPEDNYEDKHSDDPYDDEKSPRLMQHIAMLYFCVLWMLKYNHHKQSKVSKEKIYLVN